MRRIPFFLPPFLIDGQGLVLVASISLFNTDLCGKICEKWQGASETTTGERLKFLL